jgi:acyl-CoA synthetase (AMP-forming)/AMP-acid ligase II
MVQRKMPTPGTESPTSPLSYVELLELRAGDRPGDLAYAFLSEGEETERATFGELDRRARAVAARLSEHRAAGERVLLLFPPGLDYVAAFFGCLYAGAVAVPAYPPRMNRNLGRLLAIVADARPRLVLTTAALLGQSGAWRREAPGLAEPTWLAVDPSDAGDGDGFRPPAVAPDDLALLQYTSGSTGDPKGVMVSHRNLLHNQRMMAASLGHGPDTVIVSWLPLYHDMGLIGNVLTSAYHGGPCYVMAPVDFLKSPVRWLEAIGRYRATFSGGPDFGYARCVERVTPEEIERLDLSSWKAAFNGSEPVRADTLERFAATFARCGFRREALFPCFGLAEATLFVAGRFATRPETAWSRAGLAAGRAVPAAPAEEADVLVSCGTTTGGSRLAIAEPETGRELPEGAAGEIWLAGDSVARGYWGRPEATAATFAARLVPAAGGAGPTEGWLRTGDLGFVAGGELYVNGRLKDLIVMRGRNFHPHDLERLVDESHPALRPGYAAAFSVEAGGAERLVLVAEVRRDRRRGLDAAEVIGRVRAAVRAEHAVDPAAVVLLRPGGLPKTSSGKTQRATARAAFLAGGLDALGEWRSKAAEVAPSPPPASHLGGVAEIESWLAGELAARLELPAGTIDRGLGIASDNHGRVWLLFSEHPPSTAC